MCGYSSQQDIYTLTRKMTSFRQFENITVLGQSRVRVGGNTFSVKYIFEQSVVDPVSRVE